jgi:hypothetical protein
MRWWWAQWCFAQVWFMVLLLLLLLLVVVLCRSVRQ